MVSMRIKRRYILADKVHHNAIIQIKSIRHEYEKVYGRDDLVKANIVLINLRGKFGYYSKDRFIVIRCNLERYKQVMKILRSIGVKTYLTSGTLRSLKKQLLLIAYKNIDGDEVRAAPG